MYVEYFVLMTINIQQFQSEIISIFNSGFIPINDETTIATEFRDSIQLNRVIKKNSLILVFKFRGTTSALSIQIYQENENDGLLYMRLNNELPFPLSNSSLS